MYVFVFAKFEKCKHVKEHRQSIVDDAKVHTKKDPMNFSFIGLKFGKVFLAFRLKFQSFQPPNTSKAKVLQSFFPFRLKFLLSGKSFAFLFQ